MSSKILQFQTGRERWSIFIEQVCHKYILQNSALISAIRLVVLLHRPHQSTLELPCPLLLHIYTEITEQKISSLESTLLGYGIICREISMHLHTPLSAKGSSATEIIEDIKLASHLTTVDKARSDLSGTWAIRVEICQHIGILSTECRHIIHHIYFRCSTISNNLRIHPLQTSERQTDTESLTCVSCFDQLGIALLSQIWLIILILEISDVKILVSRLYIFTPEIISVHIKIHTRRISKSVRTEFLGLHAGIEFFITVKNRSLDSQIYIIPTDKI